MDRSAPHPIPAKRFVRRGFRPATAAAAAALLLTAPALALDGRIDADAVRQSGGAGATSYTTDSLIENYDLGQRIDLSRDWLLTADMMTRREQLESHVLGARTYLRTTALMPSLTLSFRDGPWQGAFNARGLRRDWFGTGVQSRRDESLDASAWMRARFTSWEFDANLQEQRAERTTEGDDRETREHNQGFTARHFFAGSHDLRYSFSRSHQEQRTFGNEVVYRSHQVQYRGTQGFAGDRGRVSLDALLTHFRQEGQQVGSNGQRLLTPIWVGFSLDDTPGFLDPIEADPIADGRLSDGNRDSRSGVNIGDAAPAVREYGGDWRNIIVDFGDPTQLSSAVLYVDTRVDFPGLFDWQVFVSDDPEGRDWGTALDRSAYSMVYEDLDNGRQGWLLTFNGPLAHRRLKIVDEKFGVTEPDIWITEWEVYGPLADAAPDVESSVRGRLRGDVSYDLLADLELIYAADVQDHRYLEADERLLRQAHTFGFNWHIASWMLQARHQINTLDSPSGKNTDANSQLVSLASSGRSDLAWRFSWSRTEDLSYTARHLTHTYGAEMDWRLLPRLTWNQKVSYGDRDAESIDGIAHSWAVITTLRGDIRPSIVATVRRADRWTDREAGSGFTTFNDTDWSLTWAILPLVTYTNQVAYKVREDEQWIMRNTLAWNPIPGGSVDLRLYASDYQDTRTDYMRRGGGASMTWKPRPRLRLEAGVEQTLIKENADRNTPLNLNARGSWSF